MTGVRGAVADSGGLMLRIEALRAVYPRLEQCVVVTIMGAVSAELQSIGHRPGFFYLQHAMGLASSMGLGIALVRPELPVVVLDGDGSVLMNLGGLTTMARYRPRNLVHVVFDNESLLLGRRISDRDLDRQATSPGWPRPRVSRGPTKCARLPSLRTRST